MALQWQRMQRDESDYARNKGLVLWGLFLSLVGKGVITSNFFCNCALSHTHISASNVPLLPPGIKRTFIDLALVKWVSPSRCRSIMLYCISFQTPNYYWSLYDRSIVPKALKNGNLKSCPEQLNTPATTCYLKDNRALVQNGFVVPSPWK